MKRIIPIVIAVSMLGAAVTAAAGTRMLHVYNAAPEQRDAPAVRTFITADVGTEEGVEAVRQQLIAAGARNVNWFGENLIVCDLPKGVDASPVLSAPGITARPASEVPDYTPGSRNFASQIKEAYAAAERSARPDSPRLVPGVDFQDRVNRISPERAAKVHDILAGHTARSSAGPDDVQRSVNQNSEILTGSIKAFIIFPESNGQVDPNRENWHIPGDPGVENQDFLDARSNALGAMLDYQGQFPQMGISFRFIDLRPTCRYEPILHTMVDDHLWILDAMGSLDPDLRLVDDALAAVHLWNEQNRGGYDWVFTMFIGHSRNVVGHKFGDGSANYTAYANLGGPYQVTPYPAGLDPHGIGENEVFLKIIQHETGHVFWTLDEYPGAPGTCGATSGYLNYANMNINLAGPNGVGRCIPEIDCIMNQAAREPVGRPFCSWSRGHLGVIDSPINGEVDAVPDVFEAAPLIRFATEDAETVNVRDYTLDLTVISQAVKNRNVHIPEADRVDYAAPLRKCEFKYGGGWEELPANDGAWNSMREETRFTIKGLPPGATYLLFRAHNSAGMKSPVYQKTVYFLGIHFYQFQALPRPEYNHVKWQVVGENFGSRFDVYRLMPGEDASGLARVRPGEEFPGTLVASDVKPLEPGTGYVPYEIRDYDVQPGVRYRYFVNATGVVQFDGEQHPFNSPSGVVGQTAMVPVPRGRLISHVAPNPFRATTSISIRVPTTYVEGTTGGSGTAQGIPQATPLNVTVYDVLGRTIRKLQDRSTYEDVVTVKWEGTTDAGARVSSGVYFIRVLAGGAQAVEKVLLVR